MSDFDADKELLLVREIITKELGYYHDWRQPSHYLTRLSESLADVMRSQLADLRREREELRLGLDTASGVLIKQAKERKEDRAAIRALGDAAAFHVSCGSCREIEKLHAAAIQRAHAAGETTNG